MTRAHRVACYLHATCFSTNANSSPSIAARSERSHEDKQAPLPRVQSSASRASSSCVPGMGQSVGTEQQARVTSYPYPYHRGACKVRCVPSSCASSPHAQQYQWMQMRRMNVHVIKVFVA